MHVKFFHMDKTECLWMSSSDLEIAYEAHSKSRGRLFSSQKKKISFECHKET